MKNEERAHAMRNIEAGMSYPTYRQMVTRLLEEDNEKRRLELLEKARISGLDEEEKQELRQRLDTRTKGSAG